MTPEEILQKYSPIPLKGSASYMAILEAMTKYASIVSAEKDKEIAELKQTIEQLRLELSVADDRLMGFK